MMKGPGSWSMETLHGEALLDRESRKTVKQIDVEIKNVVVCLLVQSDFSVYVFWSGMVRCSGQYI